MFRASIFLSFLLILLPSTSHAYLVPLLGGAGAVASFIAVVLIVSLIFGFFIWYHLRRFFGKGKQYNNTESNKHKKTPSFLSRLVFNHRNFWIYLGKKEAGFFKKKLSKKEIKEPIYVTGLARSGTTIMLELIAKFDNVAVQKYRDFPFVFTPYSWNKILNLFDKIFKKNKKKERAHKDGLMVSSKSPEAMEEPIWMAYFDNIHDVSKNNIIGKDASNEEFETVYKHHIQKVLSAQNKQRYLAKGNYNLTRIAYINKILPDSKIIIMLRDPIEHIYSLQKQHKLFCESHDEDPRTLSYMNMLGHFEFGRNFTPINTDSNKAADILKLMVQGQNVKAWSIYWADIHDKIKQQIDSGEVSRENILIINYHNFCEDPHGAMQKVCNFTSLEFNDKIFEDLKIKKPDYYKIDFSNDEKNIIKSETGSIFDYFLALSKS